MIIPLHAVQAHHEENTIPDDNDSSELITMQSMYATVLAMSAHILEQELTRPIYATVKCLRKLKQTPSPIHYLVLIRLHRKFSETET